MKLPSPLPLTHSTVTETEEGWGKHDLALVRRKLERRKPPKAFWQVSSPCSYKQVKLQCCEVILVWLSPLSEEAPGRFYESSVGQIKQFHRDRVFRCYVFVYPILYLSFIYFSWNRSSHNIKQQERKQKRGGNVVISPSLCPWYPSTWGRFVPEQILGKIKWQKRDKITVLDFLNS